jgi:RHS repeat-associated protein
LDGAAYEYAIPDLRTKITRDLGLTTNTVDLGYDDLGQLTKWTGKEPGGAPRLNEKLGYGYDPAGNLQSRTNNALIQTFNVNNLNELSTVSRSGTFTVSGSLPAPATNVTVNGSTADRYSDLTFAKDSFNLTNGNNTFSIIASNVYGVRATNSLTLNLPDPVSFQYDTNGNLTGDGVRTFVYDAQNQLTNVYVTNSWRTDFVYDGFGRKRINRDYIWQSGAWVKTNETRFLYDGFLAVQERDSNNTVLVTYTRGLDLSGSLQGAGGIGGLLARTDSTNASAFFHSDGSGNVTSLIDTQQNVVARYLYDPYGRLISKSGALADANRYQFSSKEAHPKSGLYYYGFRFYDPSLQRWLNQDPIGENGGINLYRFVRNNPLSFFDALGAQDQTTPWGHHMIPRAIFEKDDIRVELQNIFNDPNSRIQNPLYNEHNGKRYNDITSGQYRDAVQAEIDAFLKSKGKTALNDLSEKQALQLVERVKCSKNETVMNYNAGVNAEMEKVAKARSRLNAGTAKLKTLAAVGVAASLVGGAYSVAASEHYKAAIEAAKIGDAQTVDNEMFEIAAEIAEETGDQTAILVYDEWWYAHYAGKKK